MSNVFDHLASNIPLAEVANTALALSLEWGENMGKDITDRLVLKYPNASNQEIIDAKSMSKQVINDCNNLIDFHSPPITSMQLDVLLITKVFTIHAWIDAANKQKLTTQYRYYYWKDGLISN